MTNANVVRNQLSSCSYLKLLREASSADKSVTHWATSELEDAIPITVVVVSTSLRAAAAARVESESHACTTIV